MRKVSENTQSKVIVAGGRDFTDVFLMALALERIIGVGDEIVNGMCKTGADLLARIYANKNQHPLIPFPADWNQYGHAAGPRRNYEMSRYGDTLVAFWDGESNGTRSMINFALKNCEEVHVYRYAVKK